MVYHMSFCFLKKRKEISIVILKLLFYYYYYYHYYSKCTTSAFFTLSIGTVIGVVWKSTLNQVGKWDRLRSRLFLLQFFFSLVLREDTFLSTKYGLSVVIICISSCDLILNT